MLNPFTADPANRVGDRFDGIDSAYEIVARVSNAPAGALAEAYVQFGTDSPITLGALTPVEGRSNIRTLSWDIPQTMSDRSNGNDRPAKISARLFEPAESAGAYPVEIASDEVAVVLDHLPDSSCTPGNACNPAAETTSLTWPGHGGPLGFFKAGDGIWSTVVDGTASTGAASVDVFYSTTPDGADPSFSLCSVATEQEWIEQEKTPKTKLFRASCRLKQGEVPTDVTAVAAVPATSGGVKGVSAARAVDAYVQQPSTMSVELTPLLRRREAGSGCQPVTANVVDALGRPVRGVNLDVQLQGPTDSVAFGQPTDSQPPEAAPKEVASDCAGGSQGEEGSVLVAQGPDVKHVESIAGPDFLGRWEFRIASPEFGTTEVVAWVDDEDFDQATLERGPNDDFLEEGEPLGVARREWLDDALSLVFDQRLDAAPVGFCNTYTVTALAGASVLPGTNVDMHIQFPKDNVRFCDVPGQSVRHDPDKGHRPKDVGSSHRSGTTDCPDPGADCRHIEGETDAQGRFTVGLTSVAQSTSPMDAAGPGSIVAWLDGEPGEDDDVPPDIGPFAFGQTEPWARVSTNWIEAAWDTRIRILGPPPTAPNNRVAIASRTFDVVARVDAPHLVETVDILIERTGTGMRRKIGEAARVGRSDTFVFEWDLTEPLPTSDVEPSPSPSPSSSPSERPTPRPRPTPPEETEEPTQGPIPSTPPLPTVDPSPIVDPPPTVGPGKGVPDGDYAIRARIAGIGKTALASVTVNRHLNPTADQAPNGTNDTTPPSEWAELEYPAEGQILSLADGFVGVEGSASPGAEGVYFYYATGPAGAPPSWSDVCGFAELRGAAAGRTQSFTGGCALQDDDLPEDVVAVAALAFDCNADGCEPDPEGTPVGAGGMNAFTMAPSGTVEAGEVRRIFVCSGSPCAVLQPKHVVAPVGECRPMDLTLVDASGLPLADQNVDVALQGPGDGAAFCDLPGETGLRQAPTSAPGEVVRTSERYSLFVDPLGPDSVHVEGQTDQDGRFVFGITSTEASYRSPFSLTQDDHSIVKAWIDLVDDDVVGPDERRVTGLATWDLPGRCTIVGTPGDDVIYGTIETEKVCGLEGSDVIFGEDGTDVLVGGPGDDQLWGDEGRDYLFGQAGDDVLRGGFGSDFLHGGSGANTCVGGGGKNRMIDCAAARKASS